MSSKAMSCNKLQMDNLRTLWVMWTVVASSSSYSVAFARIALDLSAAS